MHYPFVQLSFPSKLHPVSQLVQFAVEVIVPPVFALAHVLTIQFAVDIAPVILLHVCVPLSPLKALHWVYVPL